MSLSEADFVIRRQFISRTLRAAGLAIAPGVVDSAARLTPTELSGLQAPTVERLEEAVHARAREFPTVPTADQLPALLRDYADACFMSEDIIGHYHPRVYGSMAYLAAFVAANLSTWGSYDQASAWYGEALRHADYAHDREAHGWIAGRSTLIAVQEGDYEQAMHDGGYAAAVSPHGQLGSTLGNALAALHEAERAVQHRGEDRFTAYSLPWYRLGRFASETYTQLGDTRRAMAIQEEAMQGYPPGSTTDLTFLALDRADCMFQEGYPREAANHAARTVLQLAPERAAPIMLDRADELADLIGGAARPEVKHLRHVVRHTRIVAA